MVTFPRSGGSGSLCSLQPAKASAVVLKQQTRVKGCSDMFLLDHGLQPHHVTADRRGEKWKQT